MAVKASNTITLMRVDDGTGYTVLLSNEAHSFEGGTSAALAGSTATNVIAYKNTSQIPVTVSNIGGTAVSGNPTGLATGVTGLTASVTGNGTTSCKITFQATTSLTTVSGSVSITIAVDGRSFTKNFSFSITLKGPAGRTYFIEPSSNVLKRSADNSISPNFVEFKSYYRDGNSATRYAYAGRFIIEETTDGNTWTTIYTSTANENTVKHYLYSMLSDASGAAVATANGDTIGIPRDVVSVRCKLYAAGGTTNLMDMQSVAVVTDVDALTHEEIFDLLTNNGQVKGIYKEGNQLYISFTYAKGGRLTLGGQNNGNGVLESFDANGNLILSSSKDGLLVKVFQKYLSHKYCIDFRHELVNCPFTIYDEDENGSQEVLGLKNDQIRIAENQEVFRSILNTGYVFQGSCKGLHIGYSGTYDDPKKHDVSYLQYSIADTGSQLSIVGGSFSVSGTKSRIIKTDSYGTVSQYCYEMPAPMFGDIGEGVTDENGECYLILDDIFGETVNTSCEYQVFLQKEGPGNLWVSEKNASYFMIKGSPNLKFAWEIKVKQRDYEYERLKPFSEDDKYQETDYVAQAAQMVAEYSRELEDTFL